jgi:hypothetical protein
MTLAEATALLEQADADMTAASERYLESGDVVDEEACHLAEAIWEDARFAVDNLYR